MQQGHPLPKRPPDVDELVQVRRRRWPVEEVITSITLGQTSVVRLACADDDAQEQALEIFWDYEIDRLILEEGEWNRLIPCHRWRTQTCGFPMTVPAVG